LTNFQKHSNAKFHEICPVGDKLLHADGQMDRQT